MQTEILIFRTSAVNGQDIKRIKKLFKGYSQINAWNVDLEDWEKILRIECQDMKASDVIDGLKSIKIYAAELL